MAAVSRAQRIVEPALWVAGLLLVWEIGVRVSGTPQYILPAPSAFLASLVRNAGELAWNGLLTTKIILWGFAAGAVPGIALGYLVARSRACQLLIYPIVIFIQGLPKVTLAPLMLVWFGFADFPKVLLTALITFFPVMVDSIAGFRSIDRRKYYLAKCTGASWLQTFLKIELPSAAPNIFSGLRISIVVAVTVVIVVEWLNSKDGLGYVVLRAMDAHDTRLIFATLVVGSLIGVVLSAAVQAVEHWVLPRGRD